MKNIKKITATVLAAAIALTGAVSLQPLPADAAPVANARKAAYLREDVTVRFNDSTLLFRDEQGQPVYPLTYNGSTYLPIRAISGLMREPIEWSSRGRTVYIGKTLSSPIKRPMPDGDSPYVQKRDGSETARGEMRITDIREQKDILVMYDFETLTFKNEKSDIIYPINYNGSNYLPLRSISELMGNEITWDGSTKTVQITGEDSVPLPEPDKERKETTAIKKLYDKEAELYNIATMNIAGIAEWTEEDTPLMASAISDNLLTAKKNKQSAQSIMNLNGLNNKEKIAAEKLYDFTEMTEYYILVMENIAYMKLQGQDYSILSETFLNFALATDSANNEALAAIEEL